MSKNLTKHLVGASLAAAAIGMAGGASAQVQLGQAGNPARTFASELSYNSALTPIAGTALTVVGGVQTPLGFGVSSGQNRYIRYILSSGATFHSAVVNTQLIDLGGAAPTFSGFGGDAVAGDGVTVVSGGSTTDSCVVFQVTGHTGVGNGQSDVIAFAIPTLDVVSNATPVTATYTLHETAVSASCSTGTNVAILNTPVSGPVATFSNSLSFVTTATYTDIADVQFPAAPFAGFVQPTSTNGDERSTTNAGLANIDFTIATYGTPALAPTIANGATAVTLANLLNFGTATNNQFIVTSSDGGNFAAGTKSGSPATITGVTVDTSFLCGAVYSGMVATVNAAATTATFNIPNAGLVGPPTLCYAITGTTAMPAGSYSASVKLTALNSSVTLETVPSIAVGAIAHNGTVLQAPWFTTFSGYISRFFLTNTGTNDAPYTASFLTESGITSASGSGASGVVKAGTTLEIDATSLVTLTGGTRAAVVFNVAGPNQTIQGAYNVVNATTGSITVSPMIRPGTN
jgi:hypothetical protein